MGKIGLGILIICLYCFPFVFSSMYQDYSNHSMLGYLIMIIATSLLAFFGKLFINSLFPIIGNLLSVIISFYFINGMVGNEHWDGYFKPLTPYQLLVLVSFLNLIPQFLAINFAKKLKNKVNEV